MITINIREIPTDEKTSGKKFELNVFHGSEHRAMTHTVSENMLLDARSPDDMITEIFRHMTSQAIRWVRNNGK